MEKEQKTEREVVAAGLLVKLLKPFLIDESVKFNVDNIEFIKENNELISNIEGDFPKGTMFFLSEAIIKGSKINLLTGWGSNKDGTTSFSIQEEDAHSEKIKFKKDNNIVDILLNVNEETAKTHLWKWTNRIDREKIKEKRMQKEKD